ncbi:MAG: uncharacterized protein KVP18_004524 [Porospora cf. gigantea A]|uniref:uncharacterized protein n=2 Tax=Porospora cf. gigantea A TaxID=2853593 RepID=UPI003559B00C|nr:MAG: hypothetical protein KVP18_004524 [Porospora cf. gigantea A]
MTAQEEVMSRMSRLLEQEREKSALSPLEYGICGGCLGLIDPDLELFCDYCGTSYHEGCWTNAECFVCSVSHVPRNRPCQICFSVGSPGGSVGPGKQDWLTCQGHLCGTRWHSVCLKLCHPLRDNHYCEECMRKESLRDLRMVPAVLAFYNFITLKADVTEQVDAAETLSDENLASLISILASPTDDKTQTLDRVEGALRRLPPAGLLENPLLPVNLENHCELPVAPQFGQLRADELVVTIDDSDFTATAKIMREMEQDGIDARVARLTASCGVLPPSDAQRQDPTYVKPECYLASLPAPFPPQMTAEHEPSFLIRFLREEVNWGFFKRILWPKIAHLWSFLANEADDKSFYLKDYSSCFRSAPEPTFRYRLLVSGKALNESLRGNRIRQREHLPCCKLVPAFARLLDVYDLLEVCLSREQLLTMDSQVPERFDEMLQLFEAIGWERVILSHGLGDLASELIFQKFTVGNSALTLNSRRYTFRDEVQLGPAVSPDFLHPLNDATLNGPVREIDHVSFIMTKAFTQLGFYAPVRVKSHQVVGVYLETAQYLPDYTLLGEYSGLAEPASWSLEKHIDTGDADFTVINNNLPNRSVALIGAPYCNMSRFISGINEREESHRLAQNVVCERWPLFATAGKTGVFDKSITHELAGYQVRINIRTRKDCAVGTILYMNYNEAGRSQEDRRQGRMDTSEYTLI